MVTTGDLCQDAPWGPWRDGMLTECFQQYVVMTPIALVILFGGVYRLIDLLRFATFDKDFGKIHLMKIALCIILTFVYAGSLVTKIIIDEWLWFQIFSDVRDIVCWGICTVIVAMELSSGSAHYWALKLWWVLEFVGCCLIMQALATEDKYFYDEYGYGYDVFVAIARFCLVTILTVLGLWAKEGTQSADYTRLKENELDKPKSYRSFTLLEVESNKNPYESANFISKLLFLWPSSLVSLGYRRTLDFPDLWDLPEQDTTEYNSAKLERNWALQKEKPQPSLIKALWSSYGLMFVISGIGKLLQDAGTLFGPIVLNRLINFIENPDTPVSTGLYWSLAMFISFVIQSLGANFYLFLTTRIGNQIRSAIVALVYRKSVKISSSGKAKFTTGEIINYQAIDAARLAFMVPLMHMVWSAPLQLIVALYLLWDYMGPSMLAGVGVLIILIPVNGITAKKMMAYQKLLMKLRDDRVRLMNEALSGIRLLKFFNWEHNFFQKLSTARAAELGQQKKSTMARAFVFFIFSSTTLWVSAASFAAYSLSGHLLNAEVAFTALALFNALRMPLGFLPMVIGGLVDCKLAVMRVQKFLLAEDMDEKAVERTESDNGTAIEIENATFKWGLDAPADALTDVNLRIKQGELVAVIGMVGSGKSSLLSALLGEIYKVRGFVRVAGSIAYVPQQAWMQNASLRENILFGKPFEEAKYQQCIRCCELTPDIKILPNGDMTEIGEKGINLSGGQKQRVSLARAMYQNASIYLLDSPLSAVDAHVGSAIFTNMISGALNNKTRIFVTHQLDILHKVDRIVVMNNGTIAEVGTYDELMNAGLDFASLLNKHVGAREGDDDENSDEKDKAPAKDDNGATKDEKGKGEEKGGKGGPGGPAGKGGTGGKGGPGGPGGGRPGGRLIGQEEKWEGSVSWLVYKRYLTAAGVCLAIVLLFLFVVEYGTRVSSDWWLSYWSTNATKSNNNAYLGIYIAWGSVSAIFMLIRALSMVKATLDASTTLHNSMLDRVFHAPISFFDTTPVGRIINRFSKDMASMDENLPMALQAFLNTAFGVLGIAVVISIVTPFFLVPLLPITYLYYFMQQYYLSSSREVQRLDSVSKSPIYALFGETLNGITTIRSFGVSQEFINNNDRKVDKNTRAMFVFNGIARWLAIRLEFMCNVVVSLAALFCVLERESISAGMAGLSLSYALQLTQILNFLVRQSAEVETNIVSVERIVQYTDLPIEAPYNNEVSPPVGWPHAGEIQFNDLKLRYRANLDLVLHGITANIKPREKIGIVGRTGAGKSSLFLALFRMVEAAEGSIYIDKVNIAKLGLSDLRSRLAIIPQDPTLFIGTIRSNLDPFGAHGDVEIWDALESVYMKEAITKLPEKLDSPVVENGDNFSVGQRQLLCLGRALLRNAKILLMDEATASVDMETDELIQKTIREKFRDMTVLTIAHRINTILDSTRVMVLEQGRVAEFDTPENLANDTDSIFYSLLQESKKTGKFVD